MNRRLFLLTLLVLLPLLAAPATARERDPLGPVASMEATQLEVFPPELVAEENQQAIVDLVNEARLFGVPVAVRVVSRDAGHEYLPQLDNTPTDSRIEQETMRELAQEWLKREPIESSPGAEDGFLMLVVMPQDGTQSSAIIQPAANALPLNGLTAANIDEVVQTLVLPSFANNEISQGIRIGLSVFSYNNLFAKPERTALDSLHQDLRKIAGLPLAGVTTLATLALAGLAWWISRRHVADVAGAVDTLSPFAAGALHEGRVDDAVMTGGLLELLRTGVLRASDDDVILDQERASAVEEPFLAALAAVLRRNADAGGRISRAALRRLPELEGPARRLLEDDLASRGLFNRDGKVETMWLILASVLTATLALFTLLPSILGMSVSGVAAIVFAAIVITGVLTWAARRSWTTPCGREALQAWEATACVDDRIAYDAIVHQDDLVSAIGGPYTPPTIDLVRTLRGLGAA